MIAMSLQNTWRASKIFSGPKHNFCLYAEDMWRGRNPWKPDLKNLQCSMFGIQKSLSPSFAPSLDLISVSLYFRSRRKWPGRKQMCIARSITCDGKVFRRDFSGLLRALCRAVFQGARRKSQRQMWKSFHCLTLHLHSTLTGRRAIAHLPVRSRCGHLNHAANLFDLTWTALTTGNDFLCGCLRVWKSVFILLVSKTLHFFFIYFWCH